MVTAHNTLRTVLRQALGFGVAFVILASCADSSAAPRAQKCIDAVTLAENDIRLRIQGGSNEDVTAREEAKVHLFIAAIAADQGNEQKCWRQYNWAMVSSRP
jgi:hypothetical protein